jgi:hypothetical protein
VATAQRREGEEGAKEEELEVKTPAAAGAP